ncbi:SUMF1/EgtB/PvdO family nonheme iron enzyme, partial [Nitrosomonas communis]|uniref:formylglycine-generating enzyme family protein n=1 Tax=Nitrosomonas communis TaxID=44574 RepID=UPI0026F2C6CC
IIEQPARLAGLDVSEITAVMLDDAKDEIGALPLVENALTTLWQQRKNHCLSGDAYRQQGGIAGMLSSQADALLQRIDQTIPRGKQAALELLLRLTRINDQGRHTRQRITREEAIFTAGNGNDPAGEQVLRTLSGERQADTLSAGRSSVLRLVTLSQEQEKQYVDLIHETLIRARSKDPQTGKWLGYWPTLYDYIEKNRNRDIYRQQLKYEAEQWQQSKGLARVWNLTFLGLKKYRAVRVAADSPESHFLTWSRRARRAWVLLLTGIVLYGAESYYWTVKHELPLNMMWTQQRFRFGYAPLPKLTKKPLPAGSFQMGEQDAAFIATLGELAKHWGVPGKPMQIAQPFYLGKYEVTYEQYDYYVWQQHAGNEEITFPTTAKGGRGNRPVVNIDWHEATAYAAWLGEQKNTQCRLPTEAEWEYAARAGTQTAYPWGDEPGSNHANCAGCGSQWDSEQSAPVGSFAENKFDLYDMSGNVWEWTCSNWREQFDGSEQQCNEDTTDTSSRVVRGGSWYGHPDGVRSSTRYYYHPDNGYDDLGFRVLCSSPIDE